MRPLGNHGSHQGSVAGAASWVLLSVALFATADAITRLTGPVFGVVLFMLSRYTVQTLAMGGWMLWRRARGQLVAHDSSFGLQLLRGVVLFASAVLAVKALQHMPVAEYTAVVLLTPVLVTLLAWLVLHHPTTSMQLGLLAGGMVGAMIVIRPGSGLFGWAALLPLGVALCNAAYQTITNHYGPREDAVTTNFHAGWIGLALALAWFVLDPPPSTAMEATAAQIAMLLGMGAMATVAQLALILALTGTRAGLLMPYLYAQIAFGALAGWLLMGDAPDAWSWIGMAVIAACGVISAWTQMRTPSAQNASAA
jgi:drug/metabolite transporter (DMT)-like permease